MTKFFKGKSNKKPVQPVPRELNEIKQAYADLAGKAGQVQYNIYVLERELDQLNSALISVNNEAAARQELDKKNPPVETSAQ